MTGASVALGLHHHRGLARADRASYRRPGRVAPPRPKKRLKIVLARVAKMGFLPAQQALGMQEPWPAPCRNLASSTSSTAARHKTPPVEGQMTAKMAPYLVRFLVHSRACTSKVTKNQPQATPQLGPITQQGCKTRNVASALQG